MDSAGNLISTRLRLWLADSRTGLNILITNSLEKSFLDSITQFGLNTIWLRIHLYTAGSPTVESTHSNNPFSEASFDGYGSIHLPSNGASSETGTDGKIFRYTNSLSWSVTSTFDGSQTILGYWLHYHNSNTPSDASLGWEAFPSGIDMSDVGDIVGPFKLKFSLWSNPMAPQAHQNMFPAESSREEASEESFDESRG